MKVRAAIRRMKPYAPPLEGRDPASRLLLDFNESIVPPGPAVSMALRRFIEEGRLQVYPEYGRFVEKLAGFHELEPAQLILTNGSDQGIDIVLRALLEPGQSIVLPEPTFAMYHQVAGTLEARLVSPAYGEDMSYPLQAVRETLGSADLTGIRLLVVVNPNNPTGTEIDLADLEGLLSDFPGVAILVDEAYAEFTGHTVLPWIGRFENLAVLRTFSKAYAMPSLRLGFVAASAVFIGELNKIRGPYDVNMMAVAAAEAQIDFPEDWQAYVREVMDISKPRVEAFLGERGVNFYPGAANFLLVRPRDLAGTMAYLKENGILVRPQKTPIGDTFRLSIGPLPVMERLMEVYGRYLEQAAGDGAARRSDGRR